MKTLLTAKDFQAIILKLANDICLNCDELTNLDSAIGDGDLGMTLTIGFKEVTRELSNNEIHSISKVLVTSADVFEEKAASTFGTLLTTMFRAAGKTAEPFDKAGTSEVAQMLTSAMMSVQKRGKAQLGDKTLLDALIPAIKVFEQAAVQGISLVQATRNAVEAAEGGAEATISMKARTGRSGYLGNRTIGHKDPGAAAIVMILRSFQEYLE